MSQNRRSLFRQVLHAVRIRSITSVRTAKKWHAAKHWLKPHGYEFFDLVLPTGFEELKELLTGFEVITSAPDNTWPELFPN